MYVGVNVSAREVQETDFVEGVREALNDHGVDPSALVIEITETALLRATPATIAALTALNHLGVRVVIDNFGSGYFSLSHLRQFPVHALKIAREFTQGSTTTPTRARLAAAVVAMARSLGIETVAEAIETPPKPTGCARPRLHLRSRASTSTARCSPRSCRRWPATRSSRSPRRPPRPRPPPRSRAPGAGAAEKRPRRLRTSPTSPRRPIRRHRRRRADRDEAARPVALGPADPAQGRQPLRPGLRRRLTRRGYARVAVLGLGELLAALSCCP